MKSEPKKRSQAAEQQVELNASSQLTHTAAERRLRWRMGEASEGPNIRHGFIQLTLRRDGLGPYPRNHYSTLAESEPDSLLEKHSGTAEGLEWSEWKEEIATFQKTLNERRTILEQTMASVNAFDMFEHISSLKDEVNSLEDKLNLAIELGQAAFDAAQRKLEQILQEETHKAFLTLLSERESILHDINVAIDEHLDRLAINAMAMAQRDSYAPSIGERPELQRERAETEPMEQTPSNFPALLNGQDTYVNPVLAKLQQEREQRPELPAQPVC